LETMLLILTRSRMKCFLLFHMLRVTTRKDKRTKKDKREMGETMLLILDNFSDEALSALSHAQGDNKKGQERDG